MTTASLEITAQHFLFLSISPGPLHGYYAVGKAGARNRRHQPSFHSCQPILNQRGCLSGIAVQRITHCVTPDAWLDLMGSVSSMGFGMLHNVV